MIRGLIERMQNPDNARSVLYRPTAELYSELGITRVEDLPEYDTIRAEIAGFESRKDVEAQADIMPTSDTAVQEDTNATT